MLRRLFFITLVTLTLGVTAAQAQDMEWIKAAYWDDRFPTAWGGGGENVRDALQAAGYEVLDADQLKAWMDARISDKAYSVVVFCRDIVPDTVAESMSSSCTLRKYLNAGGKIVWYADIPFYYVGHADGTQETWGDNGAPAILGFNTSGAPRDSGNTVTITEAGTTWGLTQTWTSQRPATPSVTDNLTILAVDNSGNAAAWAKHYAANDKFRGFVRLRDTGGTPDTGDIMRLAEYVLFKASEPQPANGAEGVLQPLLMWGAGSSALWHDVYFGTDPEPPLIGRQMWAMYYHTAGLEPGVTYYWRIDEVAADGVTIYKGDLWSFTAAPLAAFRPVPRDGDKWIATDVPLTWQAGSGATKHVVYFGTDADAVANRDASVSAGELFETSYQPATLQQETTYYWAVDEVDNSQNTHAGAVWSFTTVGDETGAVKGEYFNNMTVTGLPALTRIDPAIDFSWGDQGPGTPIDVDNFSVRWTADLEIAAADTYTFISSTDDGVRVWLNDEPIIDQWVDQGTTDVLSDPLYLEPGFYSLRMEYYENGGGAVAQLSWQTPVVPRQIIPGGPLQPPARARAVYPADGAADVPQDVTLTWTAGEKAAQHQIYLGDDAGAVANATPADTAIYRGQQSLAQASYTVSGLEWNKTYYWRIDEVNTLDSDSPWKGGIWSFTTADFINVDDFEVYTNEVGNRVFQTWIDGLGYTEPAPGNPGNGTGALVGHDIWSPESPYYEGEIVEVANPHGGRQAMPVYYDNGASPYRSETERTWAVPQNWSANEVDSLALHVQGNGPRFLESAPGQYTISARSADVWGASDNFRYAYKQLSGDGSISAKVESLTHAADWSKVGVMIRQDLDPDSTHAFMVVTPVLRRALQNRPTRGGASVSAHSATNAVTLPFWVKVERKGNQLTGYYSEDGVNWIQQPDDENTGGDASPNPQTISMIGSVYVGLAVTSNNTANTCIAEFSDVKTSGSVSGQWQVADMGPAIPANDAAPLYVALQDSGNRVAVVSDPVLATTPGWTLWKIPLSEFANGGVNLTAVKKMSIGIGDRNVSTPGGSGMILVDNIRVVKPPAPVAAFTEDFESYEAGSDMHGQGGWKGWDNTAAAGSPASSAYAYSGSNSVEIIGTADLVHEFDVAGGTAEMTAMQYIPSGSTGETYFILLNTYNDAGVNGGEKDWSLQWNFNMGTGTLTSSEAAGTAEIVYDQWVELKFVIDLDGNTVDGYYNGEPVVSHTWDDNAHGTLQCVDLWGNGASSVYYDDIEVK